MTSASDHLKESLAELRELARGLHPAALERGLPSALTSLASRSTVPTAVDCDLPGRLPEPVELALYMVVCEALANVGKYARATAASVRVWQSEAGVAIEIADDGVGGAGRDRRLWPTGANRSHRSTQRTPARHQPARRRDRHHRRSARLPFDGHSERARGDRLPAASPRGLRIRVGCERLAGQA